MSLDSSFLLNLMDEDPGALARMEALDRDQLTVPTIVYTELETGLATGSSQTEALVADVTLAPYDAEAPRHAVSMQRQLSGQGRHISAVDATIAGTALDSDEAILTHNVAEFSRTPAKLSMY